MVDFSLLEAQVTTEIEKLTAFRNALRALNGETAAPTPAELLRIPVETVNGAKPSKKRAEGLLRVGSQKPRRGLTPAEIERAKLRWVNGDSPVKIAKEIGKADTWCYMAAKAHGWPPRGSKSGTVRGAAEPKESKGQAMRRCTNCGQQTPRATATCQRCMERTG